MAFLGAPTIGQSSTPNIAPSGVDLGAIEKLTNPVVPQVKPVEPIAPQPKAVTSSSLSLEDRVASYADRMNNTRGATEPTVQNQSNVKDPLSAMMAAIGSVESGGRYGVTGGVIPSTGDRAYGKYQVMGANVPSWTKEALGREMTPDAFLKDSGAQDAVARYKMNQYLQKFGTIGDVASVWLSGRPLQDNTRKDQVTGISVPAYAQRVMDLFNKYNGEQTPRSGPMSQYKNVAEAMFKSTGTLTTPYGGQTRYEGVHPGVDLAAPIGSRVRAFTEGTVVGEELGKKQGDKGYGNYVVVKDPYGNLHRYSHLQNAWVKVGQKIFTGQDLGSMGASGSTYSQSGGTGSHLDYRISDAYGKYMNPSAYINSLNS